MRRRRRELVQLAALTDGFDDLAAHIAALTNQAESLIADADRPSEG